MTKKRFFPSQVLFLFAVLLAIAAPVRLQAEGISLLTDFEYFLSKEESTDKETGIETDSEFSRFSQLYQLDIGRFIYPNVFFNVGGYFEQDDSKSTELEALQPESTTKSREKTNRPYVEVDLHNPLYKAGLAYRKRDTETSGTSQMNETVTVDEYNANLNWRPADLPLLNVNFQRIDLDDEPLTFDVVRDSLNLVSKYAYKDYFFQYSYNSLDNFNNLEQYGTLSKNQNGTASYAKGFDYKENRFDIQTSAKYVYNTVEFTGANAAAASVDTPTADPGSPFYITNDSSPASNIDADITPVDGTHPLTNIDIGKDGGFNRVSAGLDFSQPTEVDTIYILLSDDLALSTANSFAWQLYSTDDETDPNWTLEPSSTTFSPIDNQFEIRLAAPVTARQIKVSTIPLTTATDNILLSDIRAYTTISGSSRQEPENFDQYYSFGLQWKPNVKTTFGYEGYYRDQDSRHTDEKRTSLTNGLFFRYLINPIFSTNGRVYQNDRTQKNLQGKEKETEKLYSLSLRAAYLDTLNQTLTYSGSRSKEQEGSSTTNSIILRTNADLYSGWSMNLDAGYAFNGLLNGADQTIKNLRVGTTVEPHSKVNISLDYTISWTEETDQVDSQSQYGTIQVLWTLTDTLNTFFRYNFRNQKSDLTTSTYQREFNINWTPFPDGTLHFSIGYNESTDSSAQETKTISPSVTWAIARGIFLDVRYNTGTIESLTESIDQENIIAKLKIFY